jgi:TetR/AcrR family transcriptional regulator, transcriptional repressor for nem operon
LARKKSKIPSKMARTREFDEAKVIDIATNLFWKNGYHGVSTQDLIDAFGMSKSSMYGAYHDKRNLFILALENYRKNASQGMMDAMKGNKSVKETITILLNNIITETVGDTDCKGCFIVNTAIELAAHDSKIADILRENRNNIINSFSVAIQKGIDNQELATTNNAKAIASYFYNLINGMRVDAKIHKDRSQYSEIVNVALSVLQKA